MWINDGQLQYYANFLWVKVILVLKISIQNNGLILKSGTHWEISNHSSQTVNQAMFDFV